MGTIYDNRRRFQRVNYQNNINLHFIKNNYPHCQVKNLSLTGIRINGNFQVKKDDKCQIYFFHKTKSDTIIFRSLSTAVWCNKKGLALQFTSMPIESYTSLLTILLENTELPEVLLYEISKNFPFDVAR